MVKTWKTGAVAVIVAVLVAACGGGTKTLNTADLKTRVTADMNKSGQLTGVALTCPDKVDAKTGATLECQFTATASGGRPPTGFSSPSGPEVSGKVTVTLKDGEGKRYNYTGKYSGGNTSGEVSSYSGP